MIKKILGKLFQKVNPNRDEVEIIGKTVYIAKHDTYSGFEYLLKGRYSYKEVRKINQLTTYTARYGYCKEIGSVALIGIPNPAIDKNFFEDDISEYGVIKQEKKKYSFKRYSDEEAKQIGDYKVYGVLGIERIAEQYKIEKINYVYDSRYKEAHSKKKRVLKMLVKLKGKYSYKEAEELAVNQYRYSIDRGSAYAIVNGYKHVVIFGFWSDRKDEALGFRDVWEEGTEEPPVQDIKFLDSKNAEKFKNYEIYLMDYNFFHNPEKKPEEEKIDRTFKPGFDFYETSDGKDLRLTYLN